MDGRSVAARCSRRPKYGLRASPYVASRDEKECVSIGTISSELDVSFSVLTEAFQKLSDAESSATGEDQAEGL